MQNRCRRFQPEFGGLFEGKLSTKRRTEPDSIANTFEKRAEHLAIWSPKRDQNLYFFQFFLRSIFVRCLWILGGEKDFLRPKLTLHHEKRNSNIDAKSSVEVSLSILDNISRKVEHQKADRARFQREPIENARNTHDKCGLLPPTNGSQIDAKPYQFFDAF